MLSNHDVVRHATRYGLPEVPGRTDKETGVAWILSGGTEPQLDAERGLHRARAATLFELALPGSAYLYQGEELGLHEVADIPDEDRQDPTFFRSPGVDKGRDGCRVPLPWTPEGSSFGFGPDGAHLPQPDWFGRYAVSVEEQDEDSTLTLYRRALAARRELQGAEELEWLETGDPQVLAFARPGGWVCVTNFSDQPVRLPEALAGQVVLGSAASSSGTVPAEATLWLRR
ncbi:glycosidase [Mycobacteroides abscessus subsp. abscessus]|nr:glycosidase [Mycobacteroides abscessus subsp. abscessus]